MAARTISFDTTVSSFGNNTGIEVPPELIRQLGAGSRPPVEVDLGGHRYRTTVGVMGGKHLVSVSAAQRKATGLQGGDPVSVTLTVAEAPREVVVPPDLAEALDADPEVRSFFDGLSNSLQRYHVDQVVSAKAAATRERRIAKAVELFRAGKKR